MSERAILLIDDVLSGMPDDFCEIDFGSGNARPDNLAYVIYTSGSTGAPKASSLRTGMWCDCFAQPNRGLRLVPTTSGRCFIPLPSIFPCGRCGARLHTAGVSLSCHLASVEIREAFLLLLVRERVTVLNQTPSAFRLVMEADRVADPAVSPSLRVVIFGGEALGLTKSASVG